MSELLSRIFTILTDVIVPQLQSIHASQTEQRVETDRLNRNLEEFRLEMQMRFAAIHADIAACRQELEDTLVTLREKDAADDANIRDRTRKRTIH
jgi:hypothetical protein